MNSPKLSMADGPISFQVELLPARVAYLIKAGSSAGFRRAVQEASSRWGGRCEPIVPVRKGGKIDTWWKQVIDLSGVNVLVAVDVDSKDAEIASGALKLPLIALAHIDVFASPSSFTCNPASLRLPETPPYVIPEIDAPLWQVVAAGDLAPHVEESFKENRTPYLRTQFGDQIARAAITKTTMIDGTISEFSENFASNSPGEFSAVVWLTKKNSYRDCLWFWNLRVLAPLRFSRAPMFILPADEVTSWHDFPNFLESCFERLDEFSPDVIISSYSITDKKEIIRIASHLGLITATEKATSSHKFPAKPRQKPYNYRINMEVRQFLNFERRYGQIATFDTYFRNGRGKLKFKSPIRFTGPGYTKLRLTSTEFDVLPKNLVTAQMMNANAIWEGNALLLNSFAQEGFEVDLYLPSLEDVATKNLRATTTSFRISAPGKIGIALIEFGTTDVLLFPGVYDTIMKLKTPRTEELLRKLKGARREGSSDADLVKLAAEWGGRSDRKSVAVDYLLKDKHGIPAEALCAGGFAERGFQLVCKKCGRPNFIPLTNVANRPTCPGCGSFERYSTNSSGLQLFYRLNTFTDLATDQGVIPHILVIEFLRKQDSRSHLIPGVELDFLDGSEGEVDVFGSYSGKVLAGEVKTSASAFTKVQIKKDMQKSKALNASTHLMAAATHFQPSQISYAEQIAKSYKMELIILNPDQICPSF